MSSQPNRDDALIVQTPDIFRALDEPYRYKVMWGGRGSAKSWSVARKILLRGYLNETRILCTRELQKSLGQSVHKLLSDQIYLMGLQGFYEIQKAGIYGKNGTEIMFMGTRHHTQEIKSTEGIDLCWIEEAHNLTQNSFDIIDPTVRKEGSEIWITYNTRFKYDYIHKFFVVDEAPKNAWVQRIGYADNPFFPDVLRTQMEAMRDRDYEKYLHIWGGEIKLLAEGAIFGEQVLDCIKQNRQLYIPIAKNCEVDTYFDLGKRDESAIWFVQRVGRECRLIDYYECRLQEVEHYVTVLKQLGYNYGKHHMPHDANQDRLGMVDNVAKQFAKAGIKPVVIIPRVKEKNTSIMAAREVFAQCWFHDAGDCDPSLLWKDKPLSDRLVAENMVARHLRMEKGFETLRNYRYRYVDEDDVYHHVPHHDHASNGADAFQQFAMAAPRHSRLRLASSLGRLEPEHTADY